MRRSAVVAGLATVSLILAACGSGGGADTQGDASGTTTLTVGSTPSILNASLFYASQDGIFKNNGLQVTPKIIPSGEQAIPLLLNGQLQFTASDPVGVISALSHNLSVTFVCPAAYPSPDPARDFTGLLVKPSITMAADLNGKTVAVNAIGAILQLGAEAAIDAAGGDSSSIKFVAMSFKQMAAAVKGGQVAGAVLPEPTLTMGEEQGLKSLLSVTSAPGLHDVPTVVYITSKAYASSHPDVVDKFAASLMSANTNLSKDPAQVRTVAVKSTGTSADLLAKIEIPDFRTEPLSVDQLDKLQTVMIKYKVLTKQVDLSDSILETWS
jgi:NitT/TauT family transport system substrate-binding protein